MKLKDYIVTLLAKEKIEEEDEESETEEKERREKELNIKIDGLEKDLKEEEEEEEEEEEGGKKKRKKKRKIHWNGKKKEYWTILDEVPEGYIIKDELKLQDFVDIALEEYKNIIIGSDLKRIMQELLKTETEEIK